MFKENSGAYWNDRVDLAYNGPDGTSKFCLLYRKSVVCDWLKSENVLLGTWITGLLYAKIRFMRVCYMQGLLY